MITGKRIEVVAVAWGEEVVVCTAPYLTTLLPGDTVQIEGLCETGTVLFSGGSIVYGGEEFLMLDDTIMMRRVLKRVTYDPMNWDGYEEVAR